MSHRPRWSDLPALIHEWAAGLLGAPVTEATSMPGGFSPASADRVRADNGRRAFVKTVHESWNPRTPDMHRAEAAVARALPPGFPAPVLLGELDEDGWVALAFADLDAAHPGSPWSASALEDVLATLARAAELATPCPVPDVRAMPAVLAEDFGGYDRLIAEPFDGLDPWVRDRLDDLAGAAARGTAALAGETLAHVDVRADNILVGRDGTVWLIDWPWACRGAPWADSLLFLLTTAEATRESVGSTSARMDALLTAHDVPTAVGTDVLAGYASFFLDAARRDPGPGMAAHLVEHRRRAAERALALLRHRWARLGACTGPCTARGAPTT